MAHSPAPIRTLPIVTQVKEATKPANRIALSVGFALGSFVPVASYVLAHHEVNPEAPLYKQIASLLVLSGLVYSAKTVYEWARVAFRHPAKALGFCVLLEGVMTFAHTGWLGAVALGFLVAINGVATGCNLALDAKPPKR